MNVNRNSNNSMKKRTILPVIAIGIFLVGFLTLGDYDPRHELAIFSPVTAGATSLDDGGLSGPILGDAPELNPPSLGDTPETTEPETNDPEVNPPETNDPEPTDTGLNTPNWEYVARSCKLYASSNSVYSGGSITLRWETEGYDVLTINGEVVAGDNGSVVIENIDVNTTYTLHASTDDGSFNCTSSVIVQCLPLPPITCDDNVTFTAEPGTLAFPGGAVELDWSTTNVLSVRIEDEDQNLISTNLEGPQTVQVTEDATFTLIAEGENNTAYCPTTVYVLPPTADKTATVVADKIVCSDEAELPNMAFRDATLDTNTAADWVAAHPSCSLQSGWKFQWAPLTGTSNPGDTLIGEAGDPWTSFGPTNASGRTSTVIALDTEPKTIWVREVLQSGFIPFTHLTTKSDVSAELYCHVDGLNYDNFDRVDGMTDGGTYYCVAWNVAETVEPVPSCDSFTADPNSFDYGGGASTLEWQTTNASRVVINNGIGDVELNGTTSVTVLDDTFYTLSVFDADDQLRDTCETSIVVGEEENTVPECVSFTADKTSLPVGGGSVFLEWETLNATSVSIAPVPGAVDPSGTSTITITEDTILTLTAMDDDGELDSSCVIPIDVEEEEGGVISCADNVTFTASRTSIERGEHINLDWSTTGLTSISISTVDNPDFTGSVDRSPLDTITYVLSGSDGVTNIQCPVTVNVSRGGGGGGSSSPRCELDISDERINLGEEITLTWDTSRAYEVRLEDNHGEVIFDTDDLIDDEKDELFDGEITLQPDRDTEYTLIAERGSRKRECNVEVEVVDSVVLLQTRDQQPLVAGISLTATPYTGFEAGPILTTIFYTLLVAWALMVAYWFVVRRDSVAGVTLATPTPVEGAPHGGVHTRTEEPVVEASEVASSTHVASVAAPTAPVAHEPAPAAPTGTFPSNLPTAGANPVIGYANAAKQEQEVETPTPVAAGTASNATNIEDVAHEHRVLLSSDAMAFFSTTFKNHNDHVTVMKELVIVAKNTLPTEDGWVVINKARMQTLCEEVAKEAESTPTAAPAPSTSQESAAPTGKSSLAEAIVTGNVAAAYQMIGSRPMFSLADAAADLDAAYRKKHGVDADVSALLASETAKLSEEQLRGAIAALTGALDGVYTSEEEAVKMAIMKAVKAIA